MSYYRSADHIVSTNSDDDLKKSYLSVFSEAQRSVSFNQELQSLSAGFFETSANGHLIPKSLSVQALVVGLPFPEQLQKYALEAQSAIGRELSASDRYWVVPENLALEVIVVKWPETDKVFYNPIDFKKYVEKIKPNQSILKIDGVQIHLDGSVVLRGYDSGFIRNLRRKIAEVFPKLPPKQSQWAHIPLGRIVSDVPEDKYLRILETITMLNSRESISVEINEMKFINESRWYMTEREEVFRVKFS